MGYLTFSLLFSIILGSVLVIYNSIDFGTLDFKGKYKTLHIAIPKDLDYTGIFEDLFSQYATACELTNVKTINMRYPRRL